MLLFCCMYFWKCFKKVAKLCVLQLFRSFHSIWFLNNISWVLNWAIYLSTTLKTMMTWRPAQGVGGPRENVGTQNFSLYRSGHNHLVENVLSRPVQCTWKVYGAAVRGSLRVQYNFIFKKILKHPRFCTVSGMFAQLRTRWLPCSHRKKRHRLWGEFRGVEIVSWKSWLATRAPVLTHLMRNYCPQIMPRQYTTH